MTPLLLEARFSQGARRVRLHQKGAISLGLDVSAQEENWRWTIARPRLSSSRPASATVVVFMLTLTSLASTVRTIAMSSNSTNSSCPESSQGRNIVPLKADSGFCCQSKPLTDCPLSEYMPGVRDVKRIEYSKVKSISLMYPRYNDGFGTYDGALQWWSTEVKSRGYRVEISCMDCNKSTTDCFDIPETDLKSMKFMLSTHCRNHSHCLESGLLREIYFHGCQSSEHHINVTVTALPWGTSESKTFTLLDGKSLGCCNELQCYLASTNLLCGKKDDPSPNKPNNNTISVSKITSQRDMVTTLVVLSVVLGIALPLLSIWLYRRISCKPGKKVESTWARNFNRHSFESKYCVRAYISYARYPQKHKDSVRRFCDLLRVNAKVDAVLDEYEQNAVAVDRMSWINERMQQSRFIIVVLSKDHSIFMDRALTRATADNENFILCHIETRNMRSSFLEFESDRKVILVYFGANPRPFKDKLPFCLQSHKIYCLGSSLSQSSAAYQELKSRLQQGTADDSS